MRALVAGGFACVALVLVGLAEEQPDEGERLRIDRWASSSDGLDESTMQRLGRRMGCGHFFVRTSRIESPGQEPAAIYAIRPTKGAGGPSGSRWLYLGASSPERLVAEGAGEIIQRCFAAATAGGRTGDEAWIAGQLPPILAALLDDGNSRLWFAGDPNRPATATSLLEQCRADQRDELLRLAQRPETVRETTGRLLWRGRWLRADGGLDEVTVTFPGEPTDHVRLARVELRAAGHFAVTHGAPRPLEEWVVSKVATWKVPQRYKMMQTMAALGNPQKQFQLGAALLQETEEGAKEEGFRWLKAAAAQDYRDAIDLLAQNRELLVRSDRDRDRIRVTRCCPVPGR